MMTNKELSPEEAYKALIDGKVIERGGRQLRKIEDNLEFRHEDASFQTLYNQQRVAVILLNLTGYRLARKKAKKEVEGVTYSAEVLKETYESKKYTVGVAVDQPIKTGVKVKITYEVWEDEE